MSADLEALGLTPEEPVEVDWDAPESGQFPPRLYPNDYDFLFRLAKDKAFGAAERGPKDGPKVKVLEVTWTACVDPRTLEAGALVTAPAEGEALPEEIEIPFQRHNAYRFGERPISDLDDLIRHLGQRIEGGVTNASRVQALEVADGRSHVFATLQWEGYCKRCSETTVATYKRKGAASWPRGASGKYELLVTCPKCGTDRLYGTERVVRFKARPDAG